MTGPAQRMKEGAMLKTKLTPTFNGQRFLRPRLKSARVSVEPYVQEKAHF